MSGFGLVAGVVALFFAFGIIMGVLGVTALSAMRDHRGREPGRRHPSRHAHDRAETAERTWPWRPSGHDWEDRPGWQEPRGPDDTGEPPPPWPGRRGDLAVCSQPGGIRAWRDSRGPRQGKAVPGFRHRSPGTADVRGASAT